jgi:hypothetical protein
MWVGFRIKLNVVEMKKHFLPSRKTTPALPAQIVTLATDLYLNPGLLVPNSTFKISMILK